MSGHGAIKQTEAKENLSNMPSSDSSRELGQEWGLYQEEMNPEEMNLEEMNPEENKEENKDKKHESGVVSFFKKIGNKINEIYTNGSGMSRAVIGIVDSVFYTASNLISALIFNISGIISDLIKGSALIKHKYKHLANFVKRDNGEKILYGATLKGIFSKNTIKLIGVEIASRLYALTYIPQLIKHVAIALWVGVKNLVISAVNLLGGLVAQDFSKKHSREMKNFFADIQIEENTQILEARKDGYIKKDENIRATDAASLTVRSLLVTVDKIAKNIVKFTFEIAKELLSAIKDLDFSNFKSLDGFYKIASEKTGLRISNVFNVIGRTLSKETHDIFKGVFEVLVHLFAIVKNIVKVLPVNINTLSADFVKQDISEKRSEFTISNYHRAKFEHKIDTEKNGFVNESTVNNKHDYLAEALKGNAINYKEIVEKDKVQSNVQINSSM